MAALGELRELKRQERILVNLASKISDQLNRLKVEELALVSKIRIEEEDIKREDLDLAENDVCHVKKEESEKIDDFNALVDLSIPGPSQFHEEMEEEEEEEEEDEEHDDLTSFITELTQRNSK
ncbi:hypothetical protein ScPMuIL_003020 [Solemya velum]